jgi:hypothetical protein
MARALLALVLMLAVAPAVAAREALAALDSCIQQLDPLRDVGYQKVATVCPDLAPSLKASPWQAWLPSDWDKPDSNLSRRGLHELRALIVRESGRAAGVREPRLEGLAPVLATLHDYSAAEHRGWWARFRAWLHDLLTRRPAPTDDSWIRRLFARLSIQEGVLNGVRVGALVLLGLLASGIVFGELRAAGLIRGRRRLPDAGGALRSGGRAHTWADIEGAQLSEQPRLLLELITARLAAQDRLPPARALTVRELLGAARLPREGDRERLSELARMSERLRFSDRLWSPHALGAAIERGRELLVGLEAAPQ